MANRPALPTVNAARGGSLPVGPKRKPLAPLQVEVPSTRCDEAKPHAARPELRKRVGAASQKKGWWPKRNNVTRMSSTMVRQAYELLGSVVLRDPEEEAVARGWLSGRYNRDQVHQQAALEGTTVWSLPQTQAFAAYKPSVWTIVYTLVGFPMLCTAISMSSFLLPRNDVEDGAWDNWWHYVALGLAEYLVTQVPIATLEAMTRIPMPWRLRLLLPVPGALVMMLLAFSLSVAFSYPVWYTPVTCGFPGFIIVLALTYKSFPRSLRSLPNVRKHMLLAVATSSLMLVAMSTWAVHRLGFVALADSGFWQTLFAMLLPVIKFSFRFVLNRLCAHVDDDIAPSLVFVVEYFNNLFIATLMADTTTASAVFIVGVDVVMNIMLLAQLKAGLTKRQIASRCSLCRTFAQFIACTQGGTALSMPGEALPRHNRRTPSMATASRLSMVSRGESASRGPDLTGLATSFTGPHRDAPANAEDLHDVGTLASVVEGDDSGSDASVGSLEAELQQTLEAVRESSRAEAAAAAGVAGGDDSAGGGGGGADDCDGAAADADSGSDGGGDDPMATNRDASPAVGVGSSKSEAGVATDAALALGEQAQVQGVAAAAAAAVGVDTVGISVGLDGGTMSGPTTSAFPRHGRVDTASTDLEAGESARTTAPDPSAGGLVETGEVQFEPPTPRPNAAQIVVAHRAARKIADKAIHEAVKRRWRLRMVEIIVVAEFVECFTPIQYLIFMQYAYHGWISEQFYGFSTMTQAEFDRTERWVGVFALVELAGFVAIVLAMMQMKMRPLAELCFVIRRNFYLLASSCILMFVYTMALILKHDGCEFLFFTSDFVKHSASS